MKNNNLGPHAGCQGLNETPFPTRGAEWDLCSPQFRGCGRATRENLHGGTWELEVARPESELGSTSWKKVLGRSAGVRLEALTGPGVRC